MAQGAFIAYYRVSTTRQGKSGLGLEAQRSAIMNYLNGGNWKLVEEHTEVESGKRVKNRPALAAALAACKKHNAMLVIAKLDRLARNVAFVSSLMESKVKFVIVEMPDANKFTIHIIAAVAEHEAEQISERTKAALAAAKARGVKLGRSDENKAASVDFARLIAPVVHKMQVNGCTSVRKLCDALNAASIPTFRGVGQWHIPTVHKLLKQIETL
jgi:DNA invertase Pin-like site-specific DNA recombinase